MATSEWDEAQPFFQEGEVTSDGAVKRRNKYISVNYDWLTRTLTLPFCFFVINAFASVLCAVFFVVENDFAFMLAGPLGITIGAYGVRHFRTLILLKSEIDDFATRNRKMKYAQRTLYLFFEQ